VIDPKKLWLIQFAENEHRVGLKDRELARVCVELLRQNPTWSLKDLAKALSKHPSWVTRYSSVSKVIQAVREAFEGERLTISQVYAISQAPSEREQHELLAAALGGASKEELQRALRRMNRPKRGDSAARVNRVKCPMANATVIVSGDAIGLDEAIDAVLAAAKEMKRARDEGLDAKTATAVWEKRLKRSASADAAVGDANS
jgi:hypothetical protein